MEKYYVDYMINLLRELHQAYTSGLLNDTPTVSNHHASVFGNSKHHHHKRKNDDFISNDEMADSAFGQASNTAKILKNS